MEQGAGALDAKLWSRTWVTRMGFALGLCWLAIGAVVLAGMIGDEEIHRYTLGYRPAEAGGTPVGRSVLQLLAYSFLHRNAWHLAFDLLWLAGLVQIARQLLNPGTFLRLYSLGAVGGGLVFLTLCWVFRTPGNLEGGTLIFAALLGGLAVFHPRVPGFLFGEAVAQRLRPRMGVVCLIGVLVLIYTGAGNRSADWPGWLVAGIIGPAGHLLFLAILAVTWLSLKNLALLWLGYHVLGWAVWGWYIGRSLDHPYELTVPATLAGGALYALIATKWQRRAS